MPHFRARTISIRIQKALSFSPIVGLFGQRQVGKTTLLTQFSKSYETLDLRTTLERAEADPMAFLKDRDEPFGVDECQLSPDLFPALKESVRRSLKPGRYLLTGSVKFLSKAKIRESLTGRIVIVEVLSLSVPESYGDKPIPILKTLMQKPLEHSVDKHFSEPALAKNFGHFSQYLERGGLPGICSSNESVVRQEKFAAHLETLLERDLRTLKPTTLPFRQLRLLLQTLALHEGHPIKLSMLARETRISALTLKSLILALEGLFLIRRIPILGGQAERLVLFRGWWNGKPSDKSTSSWNHGFNSRPLCFLEG